MIKKFSVREAWLLDENGNKSLKMKQLDPNEVIEVHVDLKSIRGGIGEITDDSNKSEFNEI
ncbi:hypothetical protein [Paenibacillus sp. LK1]|uniref:hypothetical protein n=1 Tax=Paenibacillus sp. LK1 TaxID=2053014 RepID=UPI000C185174|nr:hypothetical protein [Paenibacillus sp. LK1]PIH59062.1 hypothetical protein CS562_14055 [Paenibacillus sp. LK1]